MTRTWIDRGMVAAVILSGVGTVVAGWYALPSWGHETQNPKDEPGFLRGMFHAPGADDGIPYGVYRPPSLTGGGSHPLVVFLHDADERTKEWRFLRHGMGSGVRQLVRGKYQPAFIALMPYDPDAAWESFDAGSPLRRLVDDVVRRYHIDRKRICLVGAGAGGTAAWRWAGQYPEVWAAVAVAGCDHPGTETWQIQMPTWVCQSQSDVPATAAWRKVQLELRRAGLEAWYQEPAGDRREAAHAMLSDSRLYDWLAGRVRAE